MSPARPLLYCSFCRKDEHRVDKLVAGPGVYICGDCIGLCVKAVRGKRIPAFPGWEALADEQILATLPAASAAVGTADAKLHEHVALLRKRGVSWERIGEALGTTRQSAWERFARDDG